MDGKSRPSWRLFSGPGSAGPRREPGSHDLMPLPLHIFRGGPSIFQVAHSGQRRKVAFSAGDFESRRLLAFLRFTATATQYSAHSKKGAAFVLYDKGDHVKPPRTKVNPKSPTSAFPISSLTVEGRFGRGRAKAKGKKKPLLARVIGRMFLILNDRRSSKTPSFAKPSRQRDPDLAGPGPTRAFAHAGYGHQNHQGAARTSSRFQPPSDS